MSHRPFLSRPLSRHLAAAMILLLGSGCGLVGGDDIASLAPGVEIDQDGNVISGEFNDGEGSFSVASGDEASIPSDFPIPVPDGATVVFSLATEADSESYGVVQLSAPIDQYDRIVQFYTDYLAEIGAEATHTTSDSGSGPVVTWLADEPFVNIVVQQDNNTNQVFIALTA